MKHHMRLLYILEGLGYFVLPFGTLAKNWFFLHSVINYGFLVKNLQSMELHQFFNMHPKTHNHYYGWKFLPADVRSLIFYMF